MMEHRLDNRVQTPIHVTIHMDNGNALQTRANNLSRGGLCVEMEAAWGIREKKLVLIEFMEEMLPTKIPALVIETTGKTACLMFIEHSPELHTFLSQLNK